MISIFMKIAFSFWFLDVNMKCKSLISISTFIFRIYFQEKYVNSFLLFRGFFRYHLEMYFGDLFSALFYECWLNPGNSLIPCRFQGNHCGCPITCGSDSFLKGWYKVVRYDSSIVPMNLVVMEPIFALKGGSTSAPHCV